MKFKSIIALVMASALVVSSFAGCAGKKETDSKASSQSTQETEKKNAKTSLVVMSAMPTDTFDPFPAKGTTPETEFAEAQLSRDSVAMNMVYSKLVKMGKDGMRPDIATAWETPDENTIIFTIRTDVKFSDGTPLTMDDVIFSLESFQKSLYGMMSPVPFTTIEKLSDTQLKVGKLKPYSKALEFIASSIVIVSKAAYTAEGGKEAYKLKPVGSGPYIVDSINDAGDITFKRFDDYYDGKRDFEKVTLRKPVSSAAATIELTAGTLDVLLNASPSDKQTVESNTSLKVLQTVSEATSFMALHGKKFENKDFREAIYLAIDKEALVGFALEGEGVAAKKILSDELLGDLADKINPLPGFDVEKAKAKLDASGVDKTQEYKILADAAESASANAIKSNLTAIGLTNVKVEAVDTQTFYANLGQGLYEMSFWSMGSRNQALEDAVGVFATAKKAPNGSPYNALYGGETDVINVAFEKMMAPGASKEERDAQIVTILNDAQSNFVTVPLYSGYSFSIINAGLDFERPNSDYSAIYIGDIKNK